MGKTEIKCPHCNKQKYKIEIKEKVDKKGVRFTEINVKKGKWHPVFTQVSPTEWMENWELGIGVKCKCEKTFFLYNLADESKIDVQSDLVENIQFAAFCVPCRASFLSPDLICPSCGARC